MNRPEFKKVDLYQRQAVNNFKQTLLNNLEDTQKNIADNHKPLYTTNNQFLSEVSNTCTKDCNRVSDKKFKFEKNKGVNHYSDLYGSTPLTLAVLKGVNHVNNHECLGRVEMQEILDKILQNKHLEINKTHNTGLTALDIAIIRHDDPSFIQTLINAGANTSQPVEDLLSFSYEEVQNIVWCLTGALDNKNELEDGRKSCFTETGNICMTATLPTKQQFEENCQAIQDNIQHRAHDGCILDIINITDNNSKRNCEGNKNRPKPVKNVGKSKQFCCGIF